MAESTEPSSHALIPSISIDTFLAQRDSIHDRVRAAARSIAEAMDIATQMTGDTIYDLRIEVRHGRDFVDEVDHVCRAVDAALWSHLLDKSGLRTFLDATARERWADAFARKQVPELSRANIEATFSTLHQARGAMFERGVCEVFRKLSWDYKTNCPRAFGKRLVLTFLVDTPWEYARVSHRGADRIDDLLRVFSVLDGAVEPDHRQGAWHALNAARWPKETPVFAFPYFTLKGFKNGNGHLAFTRPDLVDEMNRILAKHNERVLPPEQ